MTYTEVPDQLMSALQGVIPAVIASTSGNSIPNVTYISQVFYVDKKHVALSQQFFNKTIRNVFENPIVRVVLTDPVRFEMYKLLLKFKESQTSGEVFDSMYLQLEAIASVQGKEGVFHLRAADIYEVLSIETLHSYI